MTRRRNSGEARSSQSPPTPPGSPPLGAGSRGADRGGVRGCEGRGAGGADALHDGRLSRSRDLAGGGCGLCRRRRRSGRARRALLRSAGRWADDPCCRDRGARGGRRRSRPRWRSARRSSERVPVVLMVYANMVLAHGGAAEFARLALAARAPPARSSPTCRSRRPRRCATAFAAAGLALVPLVAPTTPAERRGRICAGGAGIRLRRLHRRHHRRARRAAAGARRAGRRDQGRGRGAGRGRLRHRHRPRRRRRWDGSPTA